ncbi:hypothetical protein BAUCODRAFT_276228 [Baudoinia panamericana UAMH 10762]|uniref:Uncharacterized protein n=1 Tax=Baudoinia panamericana (strain UAMH 10762) TaxID=717646 RepID=M2MZL1_BAUPA|nr:uncharacterized protein BAUCODRAFT_276228 [Baudoinia panamericana UAMH 10762]EMC92104.1 hypothetical protein BAUCODRAFT_276228 [Baudoinia panamericana UAMH 10762]
MQRASPLQQPRTAEMTPSDYDADPSWRSKPVTPAQLLVHDLCLEAWRRDIGPFLEINEHSTPALVPEVAAKTTSKGNVRAAEATRSPIEKQKFISLRESNGWTRLLRLRKRQRDLLLGNTAKRY